MGRAMTTGGAFTFKGERRAHPGAVTRCFRDIVRSWRTGHWRGGMAMTRHYDRLAHRGLGFDRFGRGRFGHWRLLHGFCDRGDSFHWRCNDRRRFHRFRFYHHRLGVERHWRDSLRRFDSRCFGDRLLRRWLDGCWRDNFRSINDQRLGGRYGSTTTGSAVTGSMVAGSTVTGAAVTVSTTATGAATASTVFATLAS